MIVLTLPNGMFTFTEALINVFHSIMNNYFL